MTCNMLMGTYVKPYSLTHSLTLSLTHSLTPGIARTLLLVRPAWSRLSELLNVSIVWSAHGKKLPESVVDVNSLVTFKMSVNTADLSRFQPYSLILSAVLFPITLYLLPSLNSRGSPTASELILKCGWGSWGGGSQPLPTSTVCGSGVSSHSGVRVGASTAEGFSCILSRQIAFPSISIRVAYSLHG